MNRAKPGRSSEQHPDRTAWDHRSSARGVGAGRAHSKENLKNETNTFIQDII